MKRLSLAWLLICFVPCAALAQMQPNAAGVPVQQSRISMLKNSSHDFSVNSSATLKAATINAQCLFCHTAHKAQPAAPLWNHTLSTGVTYQVYQSTTLFATMPQPQTTDSSKLCFSCHDGTVALGDTVNNGQIPFQNVPANQYMPTTVPADFGLNLSNHHPIAISVNSANPQVRQPQNGDQVRADGNGLMQCTSCHDPHNETIDPVENKFLVKSNSATAICLSCHDLKGGAGANLWSWSGDAGTASSHQSAANVYNTQTNGGITWLGAHTGYTTTMTNGCEACHNPHAAHTASQLMKGETDQVCFQCHDGNVLTQLWNLKSQFTAKMYIHPSLGVQPGHDPDEAPGAILTRHASCDDCHNAHGTHTNPTPPVPPQLSASLLGVSGIAIDGSPHDPRRGTGDALYEYELCLKCHSYNPNKPQVPGYQAYGPLPNRLIPSTDMRQAISSGASWHPVSSPRGLTAGPGGAVPSLLPAMVNGSGTPMSNRPLSGAAQIYCVDCHSNDTGRNLGPGNTDPPGPHGSGVIHILERAYTIESATGTPGTTPNIPYASSDYQLCFKCHSEQSLLRNDSFPNHSDHMAIASCATCHDPHGVPNGTTLNNSSLINFDLNIVAPNSAAAGPVWTKGSTPFSGSCNLLCHGYDHNSSNATYGNFHMIRRR